MALVTDIRAAIRALVSARAFTAVAVLTLSAGLALAGTIVAVVNAYALRALPYPSANRLYRVDYAPPGQPGPRGMEQLDWPALSDVVDLAIAWDLDVFYLLGREYPESAPGAWVTPGYLEGLGVRAAIGRSIGAADFRPDSPSVALISHRLWQSRFGGDTEIVGTSFNAYVSDRPEEPEAFTIVGVLPRDWWHMNVYTDVLAPLKAASYPYQVRLREGVTPAVATRRIDQLIRGGAATLPPRFEVTLTSLQESYIAQLAPMLWAVVAAAGLVLLIASANVAVLMIVRARQRDRELAVRYALGASHTRVMRMLAFEGAIVGAASTAAGLLISRLAVPAFAPFIERALDRRVPGGLAALAPDATVTLLVIACGLVLTVLFSLFPIAMVWRLHGRSMAGSMRGVTDHPGAGRSRALLIALEIAASLTLLVGAALMAASAVRMLDVDFGIEGDEVVTASLALRQRAFPDDQSRVAFFDRLERELSELSDSRAVAFGDWWPLQGSRPRRAETGGSDSVIATANPFAVSPNYFATLGIDLVDGRTFTADDRLGREAVVMVSASLASRLWPGERAVGRRLTIHPDGEGQPDNRPDTYSVVGVVRDVRQSHADSDLLDAYLPIAQRTSRFAFVYLRGRMSPTWDTQLRAAIARVHPEVAIGAPRILSDGIEQERARPRFLAYLLTTFAAFACVLALVGMYGVVAYAVRQRQREIAVRLAIGAAPAAITRLFLRDGARVLAVGLVGGIAGAIALGRVLQSQLYGVRPAEPGVLTIAVFAFGLVAMAAVLWPARRAAATDPAAVLKQE